MKFLSKKKIKKILKVLSEYQNPLIPKSKLLYLIEQLNLYADLSSNRNLLWKSTLELEFPIEFLFSQLACEKLSIELRIKILYEALKISIVF